MGKTIKLIGIFISMFFSSACYLNASIVGTELSAIDSNSSKPTPEIKGVKTSGTDNIVDEYITDSSVPDFHFSPIANAKKIKYLISDANQNEMCSGEVAATESNFIANGCSLIQGNYILYLTADYGDSSLATKSFNFKKTIMSISPTSYNLLAGETINLTPSGGVPNFTAVDQGSGFLNPINFLYQVALGQPSGSEVVNVTDSKGQSVGVSTQWQSFKLNSKYNSAATVTSYYSPRALLEYGGSLYAVGSFKYDETLPLGGSNINGAAFLKSTDGGTIWTDIGHFQGSFGNDTAITKILNIGSSFYVIGFTSGNNPRGFITESTDLGVTWSTKYIYSAGKQYTLFTDAIVSQDNHIIVVGYSYQFSPSSSSIRFTLRCNTTSWTCSEVEKVESLTSYSEQSFRVVKDASHNLYSVSRHFISMIQNCRAILNKSIDNGVTWIQVTDQFCYGDFEALAVSSDGQSIIMGGGAVDPEAYVSLDAGATWVSLNIAACGWSIQDFLFDSSKNILGTCYDWASGPGYTWTVFKLNSMAVGASFMSSPGYYPERFFVNSANRVIAPIVTEGKLKFTDDFGVSWGDLTYPTVAAKPAGLVLNDITEKLSNNTLYAVGLEGVASTDARGVIYKSTNNGVSWSKDLLLGFKSAFNSVAETTFGTFAAGNNNGQWYTYKIDSGASDNITVGGSTSAVVNKIVSSSTTIYAIGSYVVSGKRRGLIRSSTNGGASWSDFSDFQFVAGFDTNFLGGTFAYGNLYVAGYYIDGSSVQHLLVRKWNSTDGWRDIETDTVSASAAVPKVLAVAVAADGTLYSVGEYSMSSVKHWLVKKRNALEVWEVSDDFNMSPDNDSGATSIAIGSNGTIYVSGYGNDNNKIKYSLVRAFKNNVWFTTDQHLDEGLGEGKNISSCLTNKICLVGKSLNNNFIVQGFIKILD